MRKPFDRTIGIAFISFIVLGLPDGLLGLAWPMMRLEYDLTAASLGVFLSAATLGFVSVSLLSGALTRWLGVGNLLLLAFTLQGIAFLGFFVAPSWAVLVGLSFLSGIGGGGIDTGMNIYVASYGSTRFVNWLHGFFGVGATVGPLLMTALLTSGVPWQRGYMVAGGAALAIAVLIGLNRNRFVLHSVDETEAAAPMPQTLRLPLVWLGMLAFAVYAGLEVSAGQWSFSLFTQGRALDVATAGIWVSLYWGSFTVGRFLFGFIGEGVSINRQLSAVFGLSLVGVLMLWLNPTDTVGLLGLAVLGVAFAPIFPLLVVGTRARIGQRHAANAIGLQVGAASFGVGVLPGLAGAWVDAATNPVRMAFNAPWPYPVETLTINPALEVIGPFLLILLAGTVMIYALMGTLVRRKV